jgi:hypothetical protein
MLKNLLFGAMVTLGLCATGGEAKAQYRYGGGYYAGYRPYYYAAPYYGTRVYVTPAAGYAYTYSGYGPYYNYGYRYYAPPPAVVYPAPVYYGPRVGVSYVSPHVGVRVGF